MANLTFILASLLLLATQISGAPVVPNNDCKPKTADVVFLLDGSSSIYGEDFKRSIQFIQTFNKQLSQSETSTRIGVVLIGSKPKVAQSLASLETVDILNKKLDMIKQPQGGTNTASALQFVRQRMFNLKANHKVQIGIVITDGQSDIPRETTKQADLAKEAGVYLFGIGVGPKADMEELENLASSPNRSFTFYVDNFTGLSSIQKLLSEQTCNVTQQSFVKDETQLPTDNTGTVKIPASEKCSIVNPADIVFVLPASSTPEETNHVMDLAIQVSGEIEVGAKEVHIGMVPRQDFTVPEMRLDDFDDKADLTSTFKERRFRKFKMADQMRYLRTQSFSRCHGGRNEVKKIAVVVLGPTSENLNIMVKEFLKAKQHDIEIFIVTVGMSNKGVKEAHSLASSQQNLISVSNYNEVHKRAHSLVHKLNKACADFQR